MVQTISSDSTGSETGVRVVIHSPGTAPDFDSGITFGPGTESTVYISMTNRSRLGPPHNPEGCTTAPYLDGSNLYKYTQSGCVDTCKQQKFIDSCGCLNGDYRFTERQLEQANKRICGNMNLTEGDGNRNIEVGLDDFKCLYNITARACNECKQPCNEAIYETRVSSAPWPHISRHLALYAKYIMDDNIINGSFNEYANIYDFYVGTDGYNSFGDKYNNIVAMEFLKKKIDDGRIDENFLKINFVLEYPHQFVLTDDVKYSWESFVSELGGSLSLCLGLTILTFVEYIDLVISSSYLCWKKFRKSRKEEAASPS